MSNRIELESVGGVPDDGGISVEYIGLAFLVVGVLALVWARTPILGNVLGADMRAIICRVTGGECDPWAYEPVEPCVVNASTQRYALSGSVRVFTVEGHGTWVVEEMSDGTASSTFLAGVDGGVGVSSGGGISARGIGRRSGWGAAATAGFEHSNTWTWPSAEVADRFVLAHTAHRILPDLTTDYIDAAVPLSAIPGLGRVQDGLIDGLLDELVRRGIVPAYDEFEEARAVEHADALTGDLSASGALIEQLPMDVLGGFGVSLDAAADGSSRYSLAVDHETEDKTVSGAWAVSGALAAEGSVLPGLLSSLSPEASGLIDLIGGAGTSIGVVFDPEWTPKELVLTGSLRAGATADPPFVGGAGDGKAGDSDEQVWEARLDLTDPENAAATVKVVSALVSLPLRGVTGDSVEAIESFARVIGEKSYGTRSTYRWDPADEVVIDLVAAAATRKAVSATLIGAEFWGPGTGLLPWRGCDVSPD